MRQRSRERLVLAAAEVFAEQGYAGATVTAIAERAGVSLRTLYTAWGSKRRLLRAYVEYTMTGSPTAVTEGTWVPQLQRLLDPESLADPQARMRQVARIVREIAERMGLAWRLVRDGAAIDPGVAEDHAELERLRRRSMAGLLEGIDEGSLRPGLTLDRAIDTTLVIASPSAYETLVHPGGYSMDEFERWVGDTLITALLADPRP
ncbi:TetR/AcrR family transcriptional regulator [Geodermatophilus sp. TF02-6]|nr:TetR/AcrR family transcriptional regulator [Geodermatophilus sp. TF02-6]